MKIILRANAEKWNVIKTDKVVGISAGGHVASTLGTNSPECFLLLKMQWI
jgi:hypothetical protein